MKENKTLTQDELDDINFATSTRLTKEEREVNLIYSELDNKWYADVTVWKYMNKFKKQGWKITNTQYYPNGDIMAMQFEAPAHAISIRTYEKVKREMSDEQRQTMSERMKKIQDARIRNATLSAT